MKKINRVPGLTSEERSKALNYLQDPQVIELINEYNRRYLHWEEVKRRKQVIPVEPLFLWYLMKLFRHMENAEPVTFGPYHFHYTVLADFQDKLHFIDKKAAGNLRNTLEPLYGSRDKHILNSLMEEAIASSQIEGATTSRRVAKEMLRQKRKPANKDERMIINNYDTMKYILEIKDEEMNPDLLLKIQKMITEGTLDDPADEGVFRDNNDIKIFDNDGNILHTPPQKEEVPELVNELCHFANNCTEEFIHPIIKGIFLHYLLNFIHPFNDGNGRTGRSLFYWYVLKNEYWLFEYLSVSRLIYKKRRQYKLAYQYTESDLFADSEKEIGDLTYFIRFNLNVILEALQEGQKYLEMKQKEQYQAFKETTGPYQLNPRQRDIMGQFTKDPFKTMTIKEVMTTQRVSYATARTDLLELEGFGHVQKQKPGKEFVFIKTQDL